MKVEILLVEDLENLLQWFWLEIRFNALSVVNDFMKTIHHHLQEVKDTMSYFYITCEKAKFKHFRRKMFQLVSYLYERDTVTLYETVPSANLLSRFTNVNALNLDDQKTALSKNIFSNHYIKLLSCLLPYVSQASVTCTTVSKYGNKINCSTV